MPHAASECNLNMHVLDMDLINNTVFFFTMFHVVDLDEAFCYIEVFIG